MTSKAKYIGRCVDKYDRDSVELREKIKKNHEPIETDEDWLDYFFGMLEEL